MDEERKYVKTTKICKEVLLKIVPNRMQRKMILNVSRNTVKKIEEELRESSIEAKVELQGSVAKDTWLPADKEIDIFIMVPQTYDREIFSKILDISKNIARNNFIISYAEHPYIHANIEGYTIDFVPCFQANTIDKTVSSVDRTPFHTKYMKKRLNNSGARNQVRLLKQFMQGINIYGAEIRVGGFSGYLCEILILYYGSFSSVLESASKWKKNEIIDLEGYYKGQIEKATEHFRDDRLIVIDPVDKHRNTASSVRLQRLNEFVSASRKFLKNANETFFFPPSTKPFERKGIRNLLHRKSTKIIFLKFKALETVPDVLWGQLYKSQRAFRKLLNQHGFRIIRDEVWSDEVEHNLILFELESCHLPSSKKHIGPPVEKEEDCENFLRKHLESNRTLSGPRIEGDHWIVETKRKYDDVVILIKENLKRSNSIGLPRLIFEALAKSLETLVADEILDFYSSNIGFAGFFTEFLIGKPVWL